MRIFRFSLGLMSFLRPGTPATSTLGLNCLQHPASPLQVSKCEFPGYCLYHLKKLGQSASKCDFSHYFLCRLKYLGKFNFSAFY
ncbi:hypothetical protein C8F04DRAFT_1093340 [Mycena alexandri]|uniref:Secreted protein n=1 Tax=Mycena alexandri TaxID=1745969 RepID=A0AAD6T0R3_9AGAR|nr:hypothetical protein C8F04DRAFT_1093340 [Mycena alexandri]